MLERFISCHSVPLKGFSSPRGYGTEADYWYFFYSLPRWSRARATLFRSTVKAHIAPLYYHLITSSLFPPLSLIKREKMAHLYVDNGMHLSFSFRNCEFLLCEVFFKKKNLLIEAVSLFAHAQLSSCELKLCFLLSDFPSVSGWVGRGGDLGKDANPWRALALTSPVQHVRVYQMGVWTIQLLMTRSGIETISLSLLFRTL